MPCNPTRHDRLSLCCQAACPTAWLGSNLQKAVSEPCQHGMVQAVAGEYGAALHVVTASSVVGPYLGESERRLREAFAAADADAAAGRLAVVFLDEVSTLQRHTVYRDQAQAPADPMSLCQVV